MAPKTVDIIEATAHLEELLNDVEHGTNIFVEKNHRLIAEIIPCTKRVLGLHTGAVSCTQDFDNEIPDNFWIGKQ